MSIELGKTADNEQILISLWERGIIPGPLESDTDFFERMKKSQREGYCPTDLLEKKIRALSLVKEKYGVSPDWTDIEMAPKGLAPWHGAGFIQEDDRFYILFRKTKGYQDEELLAHEFVHAARSTFEEPYFEEMFAYATSLKKYRQWLGPLVQSPKEALIFVIWAIAALLVNFFFLIGGEAPVLLLAFSPLLLPLIGAIRLFLLRTRYNATFKKVHSLFNNASKASGWMLVLTDGEILRFAKASQEEIIHYIHEHREKGIRFKLLSALLKAYGKN